MGMIQTMLGVLVAKKIMTEEEAIAVYEQLESRPVPHQIDRAIKQISELLADIK
jgi:hypothetical protein